MHFFKYDKSKKREIKNLRYPDKIKNSDLLSYFERLKTKEEKIEKVEIFKNNLEYFPIKTFGAWHEFTVVESTNWFWSFEKQNFGICVQRSKEYSIVKNKLIGEDRTGRVDDEGRAPQSVKNNGETIYNIVEWIHRNECVEGEYHWWNKNCQRFASALYEAISRQKGENL